MKKYNLTYCEGFYKMRKNTKTHNYSSLITDLASFIEQGRKAAVRYVNTALVATYWLIGRRIVEFEQKGKERAEYGKRFLKKLSADLAPRFGKGFTERNLEHMRQFYLAYPEISHTVCAELEEDKSSKKSHTVCAEFKPISQTESGISETLSREFPLSWSHYRLLMRLDEPFKREFYEAECKEGIGVRNYFFTPHPNPLPQGERKQVREN